MFSRRNLISGPDDDLEIDWGHGTQLGGGKRGKSRGRGGRGGRGRGGRDNERSLSRNSSQESFTGNRGGRGNNRSRGDSRGGRGGRGDRLGRNDRNGLGSRSRDNDNRRRAERLSSTLANQKIEFVAAIEIIDPSRLDEYYEEDAENQTEAKGIDSEEELEELLQAMLPEDGIANEYGTFVDFLDDQDDELQADIDQPNERYPLETNDDEVDITDEQMGALLGLNKSVGDLDLLEVVDAGVERPVVPVSERKKMKNSVHKLINSGVFKPRLWTQLQHGCSLYTVVEHLVVFVKNEREHVLVLPPYSDEDNQLLCGISEKLLLKPKIKTYSLEKGPKFKYIVLTKTRDLDPASGNAEKVLMSLSALVSLRGLVPADVIHKTIPPRRRQMEEGSVLAKSAPPVSSSTVGHQLLQKMGWSEGVGLGKDANGIVDPVQVKIKTRRDGLGKTYNE